MLSLLNKKNEDKSFQVDLNGSPFQERHVKVNNQDGLVTVSAEKKTRNKKTGQRTYRSFLLTVSDPDLVNVSHSFKDGKVIIGPK